MFKYSQQKEDKFSAYSGAIKTGVLYLNDEGKCLWKDSSAENLFGTLQGNESGQSFVREGESSEYCLQTYLEQQDRELFLEHIRKCAESQDSVSTVLDFRSLDGTLKKMQITSYPASKCIDQNGFMTIIYDLSIYQSLKELVSRIEELNIVGKLAGSVAHEVRNPLTVVRGHLQLLGWNKSLTEYYEQFESMIAEIDRAVEILNELLYMVRPREPRMERQNINELLNKLYELLNAEALVNQHEILYELEEVPEVMLDKKKFRQIVLNLVNNGLQAMENHNKIIIRTYTKDSKVYFAVRDHGKGIPPEILIKLGTPFLSTKANGTGLGLASCYNIVAEHKARMEVDTGPEGTTFTVIFNEAV